MYRLGNLGIDAKLDYLVRNHIILDGKVAIYPWNSYGIHIHQFLRDKYGMIDIKAYDEDMCNYNSTILPLPTECPFGGEVWIIAADNPAPFETKLKRIGIPSESIYIVRGAPLRGQDALLKCCKDSRIKTVLDVGCGVGDHAKIFMHYGKIVTGIEAGFTAPTHNKAFDFIHAEFLDHVFEKTYDLVWCSHVLEHQLNVGAFISKLFDCCNSNGKVAIIVPDALGKIVEGHVSFWNVGLLMYNIIQCGYSCRNAAAKTSGGNVSVIVPKEPMQIANDYRARGDSSQYFPNEIHMGRTRFGGINFDGNIQELNW